MTTQTLPAFLDSRFKEIAPSKLVFGTAAIVIATELLFKTLAPGQLLHRLFLAVNRCIRVIAAPFIRKEIDKVAKTFKMKQLEGEAVHEQLPEKGYPHTKVIALATNLRETLDCSWEHGELSGTVYHGGKDHTELINSVMEIYQWTNPLHFDSFPSCRKMEAEIVAMVVRMFNGHLLPDACGALTSGGTESIGVAVKTYRDWARAEKGISEPNMVMPISAHPAFDKACHYYGVHLIKVPVNARTGKVDPAVLQSYITSNTIAIVGSAVNYPYGSVDPIDQLGKIALKNGIGLHVDSCLGGFVLQFLEFSGIDVPKVDFRVPGVTTISCDTHKFGYAPKGTSTVLYASKKLRFYQFYSLADWPGGIYATPGVSGSKPGNNVAGTWAAMLAHGHDGYVAAAKQVYSSMKRVVEGINKNPHLYVLGQPQTSAVGFSSDIIDIYKLNELLRSSEHSWQLNPLQFPAGILFSLTLVHSREGIIDAFLSDVNRFTEVLVKEVEAKKANGEKIAIGDQGGTVYGSQQRVHDRTILEDVTKEVMDLYYETNHRARGTATEK